STRRLARALRMPGRSTDAPLQGGRGRAGIHRALLPYSQRSRRVVSTLLAAPAAGVAPLQCGHWSATFARYTIWRSESRGGHPGSAATPAPCKKPPALAHTALAHDNPT